MPILVVLSFSLTAYSKNEVYCEHYSSRDGTTTKHILTNNMTQYLGTSRLNVKSDYDQIFSMTFDVLERVGESLEYVTKATVNLDLNSGFEGVQRENLPDWGYYRQILSQEYVTVFGEKQKLNCRSHFRKIDE
jgi:hypothetical protein